MATNPQLIDWIEKQIDAGYRIEDIKNALLQAGWSQADVDYAIKLVLEKRAPKAEPGPPQPNIKKMGAFEKIVSVIKSPTEFYTTVRNEEGFSEAFKYLVVISLILLPIGLFMIYTHPDNYRLISLYPWQNSPLIVKAFVAYIVNVVLALIASFIGAFGLHISVYLLGGKRGYHNTYKAMVYGGTPAYFLSYIPYLNIIGTIWGAVLIVMGLKSLQDMSTGRAILALLLPLMVIIFIMMIFGALLAFMLGYTIGMMATGAVGNIPAAG